MAGSFCLGYLCRLVGLGQLGGKEAAAGVLSRFRFIYHSAFSFF